MKRIYLLLLPVMLLCSCGGKSPKSLEELKEGTPADSMMFYFGQIQANNYFMDMETDTMLRSPEARAQFMEGLRKAMELEKDFDHVAYNKGLKEGVRLAIRLREFESRYGCEFPESVLLSSIETALKSDTGVNVAEAQKGFYKIKDRFELQAGEKELEQSRKLLAKEAPGRGFEMVSDTLYAKDVTPGNGGVRFKDGDRVAAEVTATTLDGKEIETRQFPDSITIGAGRVKRVVCLAMHTMTDGQTRSFMTTPRTLFGKEYKGLYLTADEPVIFTVKVTRAE
ncbi:MAG: FKBP-type peptidyl-prolyl cis-trans isomerase [Muribaculaceae bacterium]|nr:FKBP-type peptidyl-prolyl cis-trans isomerase [Muribaculaceae bacterium]